MLYEVITIIAPDHVRDVHVHIIDAHCEIIGGSAVGPGDNQIIELGVVEYHPTLVV